MGKKIARGIGTAICILLFILCIFMIIISLIFGSNGLVGAFGYNVYLCEESVFDGINSGAAVIVEQCEPYDISDGNLILYDADITEENILPALGYTEAVDLRDGVYTITLTDSAKKLITISESRFIGRAGWTSDAFGRLAAFVITPWGVCVMAVLPCLALIIYTVVKGIVDSQPLPEVVPQRKNDERKDKSATSAIGVKPDGNATYGRSAQARPARTADSVLFTSENAPRRSPATMRQSEPAAPKKTSPAAIRPDTPTPPAKKQSDIGAMPSSVAAKRYIDNATASQKPAAKQTDKLNDATTEVPKITKKQTRSDAFFSQSEAPQIGRTASGIKKSEQNRAVIDLEDALATARSGTNNKKVAIRTGVAGKQRSADILVTKSRSELISDDADDSRDRGRYDVDDILAGLDHRRRS